MPTRLGGGSTLRRARLLVPIVCLLLTAMGCGAAPAKAPSQPAPNPAAEAKPAVAPSPAPAASGTKATLRLNWLTSPYHAAYYLALAKGYYRAAGIDLRISPGRGSAVTAQTVANGSDTFGFIDALTASRFISKGAPIKFVAMFEQETDMAFIHRSGIHIASLKDLVGHPIVTGAEDATRIVMDALLAEHGMSEKQLTMRLVNPATEHSTFLSIPNSIYLGSVDNDLPELQQADPKITADPYSRFGLNLYQYGIIVRDNTIATSPQMVRSFLAASVKGWQDTIRDPAAAGQALAAADAHLSEAVATSGIRRMVGLIHTPATEGRPLGWMARSDWTRMLSLMTRHLGVKTALPPGHYYTDAYLPG